MMVASGFLELPNRRRILSSLREVVPSTPSREQLFEDIALRLEGRTYDEAAFTFILMELFYEHEHILGEELAKLLSVCVVALTHDMELGQTAAQAFEELRESLVS